MVICEITEEMRERMVDLNQALTDAEFQALACQMIYNSEDRDRFLYIFQEAMRMLSFVAIDNDVNIEPKITFTHDGKSYEINIKLDIKEVKQ